jgi:hypothetical protein
MHKSCEPRTAGFCSCFRTTNPFGALASSPSRPGSVASFMTALCHERQGNAFSKKYEYREIALVNYTTISGAQVRCGELQSTFSSGIDNCAVVRHTISSLACGQMKRPRSNRFANRHRPSPSNVRGLRMSPRRPRKRKT